MNDGLSSVAHDIAEHDIQLNVHLVQGFLHMQDIRCAAFDEFGPVAEVGAQLPHFCIWTKRVSEQTKAVTLLRNTLSKFGSKKPPVLFWNSRILYSVIICYFCLTLTPYRG
ncbi:MAG: hypothetical protein KJZ93_20300 [Caldilineaceae bacterium]|nr:hypothetical protein [Caldilineaceae bacterium]